MERQLPPIVRTLNQLPPHDAVAHRPSLVWTHPRGVRATSSPTNACFSPGGRTDLVLIARNRDKKGWEIPWEGTD